MAMSAHSRVLLKLSGEALMGPEGFGIHQQTLQRICNDVAEAVRLGVQLCLVVGGGNIFRGMKGTQEGMQRASADYIGMLATVMNTLVLRDFLSSLDIPVRAMTSISMPNVCEPFTRERALHHVERGRVVIFGGGTGSPFFTTDTTASLRAIEMNCDALFKGTQVDGVYSADPALNPGAVRYDHLTYDDVLARDLKVMDGAAIALARDNELPIIVFSLSEAGSFGAALRGEGRLTRVTS